MTDDKLYSDDGLPHPQSPTLDRIETVYSAQRPASSNDTRVDDIEAAVHYLERNPGLDDAITTAAERVKQLAVRSSQPYHPRVIATLILLAHAARHNAYAARDRLTGDPFSPFEDLETLVGALEERLPESEAELYLTGLRIFQRKYETMARRQRGPSQEANAPASPISLSSSELPLYRRPEMQPNPQREAAEIDGVVAAFLGGTSQHNEGPWEELMEFGAG